MCALVSHAQKQPIYFLLQASGGCYINDGFSAIHFLVKTGVRTLYIDLDVHFGEECICASTSALTTACFIVASFAVVLLVTLDFTNAGDGVETHIADKMKSDKDYAGMCATISGHLHGINFPTAFSPRGAQLAWLAPIRCMLVVLC